MTAGRRGLLGALGLSALLTVRGASLTTRTIWGEELMPASDGRHKLRATPSNGMAAIYRNGLRLSAGVDYTLSGSVIQWLPGCAPEPDALLRADYVTVGA